VDICDVITQGLHERTVLLPAVPPATFIFWYHSAYRFVCWCGVRTATAIS